MEELYKEYSKQKTGNVTGVKDYNFEFIRYKNFSDYLKKNIFKIFIVLFLLMSLIQPFFMLNIRNYYDLSTIELLLIFNIFIILITLNLLVIKCFYQMLFMTIYKIYFDHNNNLCVKYLLKTKVIDIQKLKKVYIAKGIRNRKYKKYYLVLLYLTSSQKKKNIKISFNLFITDEEKKYIKKFLNNYYFDSNYEKITFWDDDFYKDAIPIIIVALILIILMIVSLFYIYLPANQLL